MPLKRGRWPAPALAFLSVLILTGAACSLIVPVPKIECAYLDRAECERAVDVALTVIGRDLGSPTSIEIADPCRGVPCPQAVFARLLERVIIVRFAFARGSSPIDVAVDRREWTGRQLEPLQ